MSHGPAGSTPPNLPSGSLPQERVHRWMRPVRVFLEVETGAGILLLICTAIALLLANSEYAATFHHLLETPIGLRLGEWSFAFPLEAIINDGLMTVFFFVVGLEIKREFVLGELRDPRAAALPLAAALGGMIVPAGIYLALQAGEPGERGWGIPMATDIAFVVGVLSLLGRRVPHSLRVLMLTLAIADDIGAVLVIAVGYTADVGFAALLVGFGGFGVCLFINWAGVRNVWIYVAMGIMIWIAFHESGVHSTVAGVVLGMMTPSVPWLDKGHFARTIDNVHGFIQNRAWYDDEQRNGVLRHVSLTARESMPPLERLETALHPWVSFGIMPAFALANAGVELHMESIMQPVSVAVAAGLVLGKPLGIFGISYLAVRAGIARLPRELSWGVIFAGGLLGGIGFTMALFIAGLALDGGLLDAAKVGILVGSVISAVLGSVLLIALLKPPPVSLPETGAPVHAAQEMP